MAPVNVTTYHTVQSRDDQSDEKQQAFRDRVIVAVIFFCIVIGSLFFFLCVRPCTPWLRKLKKRNNNNEKEKKRDDGQKADDIELSDMGPASRDRDVTTRAMADPTIDPSTKQELAPAVCDLCGDDLEPVSPKPIPSTKKFTPQNLVGKNVSSGMKTGLQLVLVNKNFTMGMSRSPAPSWSHKVGSQRSFSVPELPLPPDDSLAVEDRRSDSTIRISAAGFEPISYEGVGGFAVYRGPARHQGPEQPAQCPQPPQYRWPFSDVETDETDVSESEVESIPKLFSGFAGGPDLTSDNNHDSGVDDEGDSVLESISSLFSGFSGGPYAISETASSSGPGGSSTSVVDMSSDQKSLSTGQQSSETQTLSMKAFSL
ncbi:hypothetical protein M406DRAFT_74734 [Cryphonectria parasitica EP155]|uniref:Uncharacterized protein n=1 Tax=Cryphonectria parasitica (strain ATCC 38755 / EP155) TaxID=660469 RepID=A0A9P4XVM6_CRYP1|nr:uncharacterized protein M406DRAFT_74734 [Cryphonectria parasitica EP155]KAF3761804.1 hypothetical protein M406DRAFT_74734 [Cryphonectria parasitica EP155]